jgi:DNA-binding response OmpR family regulator
VSQTIQRDPMLRQSLLEFERTSGIQEESSVSSILVVDDDKNLSNTFKLILQSVGFNVDMAVTGLQALYKINKSNYDLVILDINLPDMLGDEVAEKIKEKHPDINIIMITGYSNFKDEIEKKDLDIKEILMKPIQPADLVKITKETLLANKKE